MTIRFAKYQALGNSFIVLDEIQSRKDIRKYSRLAQRICDQTGGVGADGLMAAFDIKGKLHVEIFNADGSWAEKSGNGVRIAAMHLLNAGRVSGRAVELSTGSGSSRISFHGGSERRRIISASLGRPVFEAADIPVNSKERFFINQAINLDNRSFIGSAVSVGNPHLILFCDDFDFDWGSIGAALECDRLFPNRVNVGFVVIKDKMTIEVRDWERGVGSTQSSGTGAAAAAVISVMRGFTGRRLKVISPAGTLGVNWDAKTDEIIIKGPVEFICTGEYYRS